MTPKLTQNQKLELKKSKKINVDLKLFGIWTKQHSKVLASFGVQRKNKYFLQDQSTNYSFEYSVIILSCKTELRRFDLYWSFSSNKLNWKIFLTLKYFLPLLWINFRTDYDREVLFFSPTLELKMLPWGWLAVSILHQSSSKLSQLSSLCLMPHQFDDLMVVWSVSILASWN